MWQISIVKPLSLAWVKACERKAKRSESESRIKALLLLQKTMRESYMDIIVMRAVRNITRTGVDITG